MMLSPTFTSVVPFTSSTDLFDHFFSKFHHPVVVFVGYIYLHTGEFWIVCTVHTFVTEVLSDFVYTLKTAYDKSLQVKLGGDTQVEVYIQRVMVGDERTGACSTGDGLKNRRLHFRVAASSSTARMVLMTVARFRNFSFTPSFTIRST